VAWEREALKCEAEKSGRTEEEVLAETRAGVKGVPLWFRQDVEHGESSSLDVEFVLAMTEAFACVWNGRSELQYILPWRMDGLGRVQ
jgi:hypothetical protein